MNWQQQLARRWNRSSQGAVLTALVGLGVLVLPFGRGLTHLSYDLGFLFRADVPRDEAVIIYMDERSEARLGQGRWDRWDRSVHADLLDKLAAVEARAVVFDILFWPTSRVATADERLLTAVKSFGKVVVAAKVTPRIHQGEFIGYDLTRPFAALETAAAWGLVEASDENKAVRQHFRDFKFSVPSLGWRVAEAVGTKGLPDPMVERWINYYGPPGFIRHFSYADVMAAHPSDLAVLSNKVVFVGALWSVGFTGGKGTDDFRTPYTRWTGRKSPGAEIIATTSLNLIHNEWLRRLPPWAESLVVVLLGVALGTWLARRRPLTAVREATLAVVVIGAVAIGLMWQTRVWFPWMIAAVIQIPCALGWSVLVHNQRLLREKTWLQHRLALAARDETQAPLRPIVPGLPLPPATPPLAGAPAVPNHELLRRIGEGAYGEVWLARDILGAFHAVKFVYRHTFTDGTPFDREFNGLKQFTPLSRAHPGLVQILHVGRCASPECLYYVMELADTATLQPAFDPTTYSPRTLGKLIQAQRRLSVQDCAQLGAAIAGALEFLHRHELVHRDIKPANIIFAGGTPKLADIGLVTGTVRTGRDASYVGTHGYIAPEGPGTRAADIYALGKVLYEAGFGMDRTDFPDLPASLMEQASPELLALNRIILKACAPNPAHRFRSAGEFMAALTDLGKSLNCLPATQKGAL